MFPMHDVKFADTYLTPRSTVRVEEMSFVPENVHRICFEPNLEIAKTGSVLPFRITD